MDDWESAPVSDRILAALRLLEAQTKQPHEINSQFVNELREQGLNEVDMEEVVATGFHFNFINRIADAYDFPVFAPEVMKKLAKLLNFVGHRAPFGKWPSPSWDIGEDGVCRPVELNRGRQQFFEFSGLVSNKERKQVEAYTASMWKANRPTMVTESQLPGILVEYLETLSLYAYRITDHQVAKLREAGFSDPQLFEINCAGAFGAALPGIENLFEVLYGQG